MEKKELSKVVKYLEDALAILDNTDRDSKIRPKYAEYKVAFELAKKGHEVQLGKERDNNTSADIYLPRIKKKVEVKSGRWKSGRWCASFYNGSQIKNGKFDYCVFVQFFPEKSRPKGFLVFTRKELEEVAKKPRKELAKHPKTNPCLLLYFSSRKEHRTYVKEHNSSMLEIEKDVYKHPKKYKDWGKIK